MVGRHPTSATISVRCLTVNSFDDGVANGAMLLEEYSAVLDVRGMRWTVIILAVWHPPTIVTQLLR